MGTNHAERKTVKQAIIANVETPRLRGVSVKHFIKLKKIRDIYEKEVLEKDKQKHTEIAATSIKGSMEDADLKTFLATGWIKADNIEEINQER